MKYEESVLSSVSVTDESVSCRFMCNSLCEGSGAVRLAKLSRALLSPSLRERICFFGIYFGG